MTRTRVWAHRCKQSDGIQVAASRSVRAYKGTSPDLRAVRPLARTAWQTPCLGATCLGCLPSVSKTALTDTICGNTTASPLGPAVLQYCMTRILCLSADACHPVLEHGELELESKKSVRAAKHKRLNNPQRDQTERQRKAKRKALGKQTETPRRPNKSNHSSDRAASPHSSQTVQAG